MPRLVSYNKTTDQRRYRIFGDEISYHNDEVSGKKSVKMSTKLKFISWKKGKKRVKVTQDNSDREAISTHQSANGNIDKSQKSILYQHSFELIQQIMAGRGREILWEFVDEWLVIEDKFVKKMEQLIYVPNPLSPQIVIDVNNFDEKIVKTFLKITRQDGLHCFSSISCRFLICRLPKLYVNKHFHLKLLVKMH